MMTRRRWKLTSAVVGGDGREGGSSVGDDVGVGVGVRVGVGGGGGRSGRRR